MERLSQEIQQAANELAETYPIDSGFVDKFHVFLEFMEFVPPEIEIEFHIELAPEHLGSTNEEVLHELYHNLYAWIAYATYSQIYTLQILYSQLTSGLNTKNFHSAMSATRAIMEHTAAFHDIYHSITDKWHELENYDKSKRDEWAEYVAGLVQIISDIQAISVSTRFNWFPFLEGKLEEFYDSWDEVPEDKKRKNVLTLIDRLPQTERGMRFFYEMISDFVHPNLGSRIPVISESKLIANNKQMYKLVAFSESEEVLNLCMHTVIAPLKNCIDISQSEIEHLLDFLGWLADLIEDYPGEFSR